MLLAKLTVKNVKDYSIVSKLTEYSVDDKVVVDIYDRCQLDVPSILFAKCLDMLYTRNIKFEITGYYDTTED